MVKGTGDVTIGLRATYRAVWHIEVRLTDYIGSASQQPLADRKFCRAVCDRPSRRDRHRRLIQTLARIAERQRFFGHSGNKLIFACVYGSWQFNAWNVPDCILDAWRGLNARCAIEWMTGLQRGRLRSTSPDTLMPPPINHSGQPMWSPSPAE
jgi:Protein of unknown function (DUF1302)